MAATSYEEQPSAGMLKLENPPNPKNAPSVTHTFRVDVAGPSGAGATSLLRRLADDEFAEATGRKKSRQVSSPKALERRGSVVHEVQLSPRVRVRLECYERPKDTVSDAALLIVYDITDTKSFTEAKSLLHKTRRDSRHPLVVLVGCKCDLVDRRVVEYKEALDVASASSDVVNLFMETSAKSAMNVSGLFVLVAQRLVAHMETPDATEPPGNGVEKGKQEKKEKREKEEQEEEDSVSISDLQVSPQPPPKPEPATISWPMETGEQREKVKLPVCKSTKRNGRFGWLCCIKPK